MKKTFIILPALAMLFLAQTACTQVADRDAKSAKVLDVEPIAMVSQPVEDASPALTSLEFAEKSFNFGEQKIDYDFSHTFLVTNTGDQDLVIESVKASCSCTVPTYTEAPIPPGKTGTITAKFNPKDGYSGTFKKTVTVNANTEPKNFILEIAGEVVN